MSPYLVILSLLLQGAPTALYAISLTVVALIYFGFVGTWLAYWLQPRHQPAAGETRLGESAGPGCWESSVFWQITAAVGGGMATAMTLWTLSYLALKIPLPGTLLSLAIGGWGSVLWSRSRPTIHRGGAFRALVLVTCVAGLLGLWQHLLTEFPAQAEVSVFVYSDLHRDLPLHVHAASLVQASGLPELQLFRSTPEPFGALSHTGYAVVLAGLSAVTGCSLFQASTAVWVVATLMIAWSGSLIATRRTQDFWTVVLCGVAPLLLGGLGWPSFQLLVNPTFPSGTGPQVAERMYWNLPQALSLAVTALGLVCVDLDCRRRGRGLSSSRGLTAATWLIVVGGWAKPSLAIFFGPALLIFLVLQRRPLMTVLAVVGELALGLLIYCLPMFLEKLPKLPEWSLHPTLMQSREVLVFVILGGGGVLWLAFAPLVTLLKTGWRSGDRNSIELPLIAGGGSIIFALLFREELFVGFQYFQPNLWWGLSGCVGLVAPFVLANSLSSQGGSWTRVCSRIGLLLITLQIINGSLSSIAYPARNVFALPRAQVDVMLEARRLSQPMHRFLLDPELQDFALAAYLGRSTFYETSMSTSQEVQQLTQWNQLCRGQADSAPADFVPFNAALILQTDERAAVRAELSRRGWREQDVLDVAELWLNEPAH